MEVNRFTCPEFEFHECTFGAPRVGKTKKALEDLKRYSGGVLFFNPQHEKTSFMKVNSSYPLVQIRRALQHGSKLDYVPSRRRVEAKKEVSVLAEYLMEFPPGNRICFAVDEAHIFIPEGTREHALFDLVRRGLKDGIKLYFISQFPAVTSKEVLRGCYRQHIFWVEKSERDYFRTKGIDYDEVMTIIEKGGLYSYAVYEGGHLDSNPHKEVIK